MILFIDTTQGHNIEIAVKDGKKVLAGKKFEAKYRQAEKLLPEIDKMLKSKKIKLNDIKEIQVANQGASLGLKSGASPSSTTGTSFTALRIGVVTANALGYALGIRVRGLNPPALKLLQTGKVKRGGKGERGRGLDIVEPVYDKEPNITTKNIKH